MKYRILLCANIKKQRGSLIGILLLMLIITVALDSGLSIWRNSQSYVYDEMERLRFGDVVYWLAGVPDVELLKEGMMTIPDIDCVEIEEMIFAKAVINGEETSSNIEFTAYEPILYPYRIFKGNSTGYEEEPEPLGAGEIYVPISFVSIGDVEIGDTLQIGTEPVEGKKSYVIKGFFEDPAAGSAMMGIKNVLMSPEDIDEIINIDENIAEQTAPGYRIHVFRSDDSALSAKQLQQIIGERTNIQTFVLMAYGRDTIAGFMLLLQNIFTGFLMSFAVILLVVAVIIIGYSIGSSIDQDYVDLGILKALGFTGRDLRVLQSVQYMLTLGIGFVIGLCCSPLLVGAVNRLVLPVTGIMTPDKAPADLLAICFGTVFLAIFLFILAKTNKIQGITPITAIRGGKGEVYFGSRIEVRMREDALYVRLAVRQLLSGKRQYIGVCMITALLVFFISLCGRIESWMGRDGSGLMREMSAALVDGRSCDFAVAYEDEETRLEVEEEITACSPIVASYQTYFRTAQINQMNYQMNVITNPEYFHIIKGRYCKYDDEIVITETVSGELGLHIGDIVTVGLGEREAEYMITGINQCANDMGANFGISTSGYARIDDGEQKPYYNYILEDNSGKTKLCESLAGRYKDRIKVDENVWSGIEGIVNATYALEYLMYGIGIVFILVTVFMTGSRILHKEQRDLGIYKSLGLPSAHLRILFAIRFGIVSALGSALGMFASALLADWILGKMFAVFGVSSFSSKLSAVGMLKPTVAVMSVFFVFAYLAAGKVRTTDPKILIVE